MRYEDLKLADDKPEPIRNKFLYQRPTKKLILLYGATGVGKSFYGQAIAQQLGATYLDIDTLCGPMNEAMSQMFVSKGQMNQASLIAIEKLEYKVLIDTAIENLRYGSQVVVCTAPFTHQLNDQVWFAKLLTQLSVVQSKLNLVWVTAQEDFHLSLLKTRFDTKSKLAVRDWDNYKLTIPKRPASVRRPVTIIKNETKVNYSKDIRFRQKVKAIIDKIEV